MKKLEFDHELAAAMVANSISHVVSLFYHRFLQITSDIKEIEINRRSIIIRFKEEK